MCRRADAGAVPHVHPVQSHERGLPLASGHARLPGRDRGSPTQAGVQDRGENRGLKRAASFRLRRLHGAQLETSECTTNVKRNNMVQQHY